MLFWLFLISRVSLVTNRLYYYSPLIVGLVISQFYPLHWWVPFDFLHLYFIYIINIPFINIIPPLIYHNIWIYHLIYHQLVLLLSHSKITSNLSTGTTELNLCLNCSSKISIDNSSFNLNLLQTINYNYICNILWTLYSPSMKTCFWSHSIPFRTPFL